MGTESIPRLLLHFALPAILGIFANALYNIVDRVFIGHFVGSDGLAAISIVFPIILIVIAFSAWVGVGTASQISRFLGSRNVERARRAFANGLLMTAVFLILTVPPLLYNLSSILRFCGATDQLMAPTFSYFSIIAPALPIQFLSLMLMETMRAEGHPRHAMWSMILASIVNVILDWVFIVHMKMGVAGAAWGTVTAQIAALVWLGIFYIAKHGSLFLTLPDFRPDGRILLETVAVGLSPFLINIFFSVMLIAFNILLGKYGGEIAISAMGIFFGLDSLIFMPVTGIGEGAMPIIGYNYGAGNADRTLSTVRIALAVSVAYYTTAMITAMIFPHVLAGFFVSDNPELINLAARSMRIGYAALPFSACTVIAAFTLQGLGRAGTALFLSVTRQGFGLFLLTVLPRYFGTDGVWATFPSVDFTGGVIAIVLLIRERKRITNLFA